MPSYGISGRATECERIDLALTREPFSLSRREARRLLAEGRVTVEGRALSVASRSVNPGSRISIIDLEAPLTILSTDELLVVLEKPAAMATQPSPLQYEPSLLEILGAKLKASGEEPSLFVVQRLDTNTTGVIVFARSSDAARRINEALAASDSRKLYTAILDGVLEHEVEVDAPIGRESENHYRVVPGGRPARTLFTPLRVSASNTLARAEIFTGRSHQVRVHAAHLGHPVTGDRKYGGSPSAPRQMLHAERLILPPFGEWTAPWPTDFSDTAECLGLSERPNYST